MVWRGMKFEAPWMEKRSRRVAWASCSKGCHCCGKQGLLCLLWPHRASSISAMRSASSSCCTCKQEKTGSNMQCVTAYLRVHCSDTMRKRERSACTQTARGNACLHSWREACTSQHATQPKNL